MSEREAALAEIASIAARHGLTAEEVSRAVPAGPAAPAGPGAATSVRQGPLGRALAYLGGTFVLAGLAVFVGMLWEEMNSLERIVSTLGSGLCALVLAYLANGSPKHRKLATPLLAIALIVEPTGILVAFGEISSGGEFLHAQLAVAAVMLVQCLLLLPRMQRTVLVFGAMVYGAIALASLLEVVDVPGKVSGLVMGITFFLLTRAVERTRYAVITPLWYFASSAAVLVSWFEIVEDGKLEITTPAVAATLVYLSTRFRSRTLLATGCLGLIVYIGYFSSEHFADSLGWPLVLILIGVAFMALGTVAVRIHRRYIRAA